MMEVAYGVTGPDRKTMVAVIATATGEKANYLGMPSQAFKIGEYVVDKEGTLLGPKNEALIEAIAAKGFSAK